MVVAQMMMVVVLLIGGQLVHGVILSDFTSRKIVSSFNSVMGWCTLRRVQLKVNSIRSCAALCQREPDCRLYCLKDDVCTMNSAIVNGRYAGGDSTDSYFPDILTFDVCYTISWSFSDVTQYIVSVDSSSIFDPDYPAVDAVNGFYCYGPLPYCFIGNLADPQGWWTADLGAPRSVSTVRVWTRSDNHPNPMFNAVEISLGNSSDYNNPVFDSFLGPPSISGTVVVFTASPPVTGQYMKLKSQAGPSPIALCHIEILE